MDVGGTRVTAGAVDFAVHYRLLDGGVVGSRGADQGVCVQVMGSVEGKDTELLRFDCFDQSPHYHYGPENKNERIDLDKTTAGSPLGWTVTQLREKLPDMLRRAGYEGLAAQIDSEQMAPKIDELESLAREMALKQRNTVTHNRGDLIIEAGAIRFGLEFREVRGGDRGLAIHVLGDVAGQEIELLAFDCFEKAPHYHYGPRNKNQRIYHDKTTVPETLSWTLEQFEEGRLPSMIQRAGYPGIVADLDEGLIRSKLPEVRAQAYAISKSNNQAGIA